jgi:flavin-dependent dehydrogenase
MTNCWDVVVVGGGPAGSACAITLAAHGWRVLLAEADDFSKPRLADTLHPGAARRLQRLTTSTDLATIGTAVACRGVLTRWGPGDIAVSDYELEQCGPGLIVRRPQFDRLLFGRARCVGATTRLLWRCIGVCADQPDQPIRLEFSTPDGLRRETARFVIDATGRQPLRGPSRRVYFDRQIAYSCTIRDEVHTQGLLWVESAEAGWWYLVSLPPAVQVVFVTEARPREAGSRARHTFFREQFERTNLLRQTFAGPPSFGAIGACDARVSLAAARMADRIVRVGDAAATTDPLAGQGWMNALDSAGAAADSVSRALAGAVTLNIAPLITAALARFDRHLSSRASLWSMAGLAPPGRPSAFTGPDRPRAEATAPP